LAGLVDSHVARRYADHLAVFDQQFGSSKAGVDLDAELLRLAGEPAADIA
jgi:hypothetical protein